MHLRANHRPGLSLTLVVLLCSLAFPPAMAAARLAPGQTIEETPARMPITIGPTDVTAFVGRFASGPVNVPTAVAGIEQFVRLFGGSGMEAASVRLYFENGGTNALVVRVPDAQPASVIRGLNTLNTVGFRLLSVPVTWDMEPGGAAQAIKTAAELTAASSAFYFIDVPRSLAAGTDLSRFREQFTTPAAAIYYPGVITATGPAAVSGAVAGRYADTDHARGFWKLPAEPLLGVQELAPPGQATQPAAISPDHGINLIRRSHQGYLPVTHRTLSVDPQWRFANVARMQALMGSSVRRGLAWATREPNTPATWAAVRSAVEAWLAELYRNGAFQGATPREAYAVKCDSTTVSTADVNAGRLPLLILFAPARPAEFNTIRIVLEMK